MQPAIEVSSVSHSYGQRIAVDDLSLSIEPGEIFAFVGPNGSGKTTLFRLLSTLIGVQSGQVAILGHRLPHDVAAIRRVLGVVFQAASLDKKLTVRENLRHQGHLYGLAGARLRQRVDEMLQRFSLADRVDERAESLSGGLRRRVELAKGMLHRPQLLLLDEPSTGLDPGARMGMWEYLERVRREDGVTIAMTTHLLEEADRADRIAILNRGKLVALDTPHELRNQVGGDSILMTCSDPAALRDAIAQQFQCDAAVVGEHVRLEQPNGHEWIPRLVEAFGAQIDSITLGKPTLEDVFIDRTGMRFDGDD